MDFEKQNKETKQQSLRMALVNWYPFDNGARVLLIGDNTDPLIELLKKHFCTVDTSVSKGVLYDCIVAADIIEKTGDVFSLFQLFYQCLSDKGVLLLAFRNRFGLKYLCGGVDYYANTAFASLQPISEGHRLYARNEVKDALRRVGFAPPRFYYLMPDADFVQAVYTDDYLPDDSIRDRVFPFDINDSPLIAWEGDLYDDMVREGVLPLVSNVYLAECRKSGAYSPDKDVIYAALSTDRGEDNSFATVLYSNNTALKRPLSPEGLDYLKTMCSNLTELGERGILTVSCHITDAGMEMPLIREESLLHYLRRQLPDNKEAFLKVFDLIWRDVLQSSEQVESLSDDEMEDWGVDLDQMGPILKSALIDMIPYNAFWADGQIRYYDQEFRVANCPAKYVLFRAINYTWLHILEAKQSIPLKEMKKRYGLEKCWNGFAARENRFVSENRNHELLREFYDHAWPDRDAIKRRRIEMKPQNEKQYKTGLLMGVFDLFHIGHLRLIQRASACCQFLRIGVLSDDLVVKFKNKRPVIPLDERMEILAAIQNVNEVVAITDDPSRILEWHRRPFDCFFSGDDYSDNAYWEWEKEELRKLGADIVFFPYTREQSSTDIRNAIKEQLSATKEKRDI